MNGLIPEAMAQGAPPGGGAMQGFGGLLMMVAFLAIFYFLLICPQQQKAKEHQAVVAKLAVGDEVVTSGGLLGRIVEVGETFITLEVAEDVRVKVQKFQVSSLMPKETLKSA